MTATIDPLAYTLARRTAQPIPITRLVRSSCARCSTPARGSGCHVSIGVLSVIATGAVIIFAPDSAVTYLASRSAIGP